MYHNRTSKCLQHSSNWNGTRKVGTSELLKLIETNGVKDAQDALFKLIKIKPRRRMEDGTIMELKFENETYLCCT
jgi:hypothetical protein